METSKDPRREVGCNNGVDVNDRAESWFGYDWSRERLLEIYRWSKMKDFWEEMKGLEVLVDSSQIKRNERAGITKRFQKLQKERDNIWRTLSSLEVLLMNSHASEREKKSFEAVFKNLATKKNPPSCPSCENIILEELRSNPPALQCPACEKAFVNPIGKRD